MESSETGRGGYPAIPSCFLLFAVPTHQAVFQESAQSALTLQSLCLCNHRIITLKK